ncbi:hypothetical protein D9M73_106360 [compost metagenome]
MPDTMDRDDFECGQRGDHRSVEPRHPATDDRARRNRRRIAVQREARLQRGDQAGCQRRGDEQIGQGSHVAPLAAVPCRAQPPHAIALS